MRPTRWLRPITSAGVAVIDNRARLEDQLCCFKDEVAANGPTVTVSVAATLDQRTNLHDYVYHWKLVHESEFCE